MKKVSVCVAGATGAVGQTLLKVLEERNFPVEQLYPLASTKSAGNKITFNGEQIEIIALDTFDFSKAQIGLFSAGGSISEQFAPKAAQQGCVVVDNTSHFRMHPEIPLVVPEVNPQAVAEYSKHNIIANPNCSTIQMVVALKPIYDKVGINRINVATYQAVSGSGKEAIDELQRQNQQILNGDERSISPSVYAKQIAYNCLPHIDVFQANGYTKEEMKMVNETRKIMSDNTLQINPTTVRIPVNFGHSEAVNIETKEKITADEARKLLNNAEGIIVIDDPDQLMYPTAWDCAHQDEVFVGRIREDISFENGLNLWVVADNVRKGAATNTVQIAEILVEKYL